MKKLLVLVNCKYDEIYEIDNKEISTYSPIQYLRKSFPKYEVQKGNSGNWNIALWNKETDSHLYYVIKPRV